MSKVVFFLCLFLLITGCATKEKFEEILDTWMGVESYKLVQTWGPPNRYYTSNGVEFIEYLSSKTFIMPGVAPSYSTTFSGNTAHTTYNPGMPGETIDYKCVTTFEVRNGRIVHWRWEGNDCKA